MNMINTVHKKDCWAVLIPLAFGLPTGRITHNTFVIGRKVGSDLVIPLLCISRKHATIVRRTQGRGAEYKCRHYLAN